MPDILLRRLAARHFRETLASLHTSTSRADGKERAAAAIQHARKRVRQQPYARAAHAKMQRCCLRRPTPHAETHFDVLLFSAPSFLPLMTPSG